MLAEGCAATCAHVALPLVQNCEKRHLTTNASLRLALIGVHQQQLLISAVVMVTISPALMRLRKL